MLARIAELERHVSTLERENRSFRESVEDTTSTSSPLSESPYEEMMIDFDVEKPSVSPFRLPHFTTTVLFTVLFSFGLLFNLIPFSSLGVQPEYRTSRSLYGFDDSNIGICDRADYLMQPLGNSLDSLSMSPMHTPSHDEMVSSLATNIARAIVLVFGVQSS